MKLIEQRFWAKVLKTEGCWLWQGAKNIQGYGKLGRGKKQEGTIAAHRLSYELTFGPIPEGKYILHKCDNPGCVRPDHLFIGSQTDNLIDMTLKGHRRFRTHSGENNGRAKLTLAQVNKIRGRFAKGELRSSLAKEYEVNWSTINRIVKHIRWQM